METFKDYLKVLKTKLENIDEMKDDDVTEIQLQMFVTLFNDQEFQAAVKEMEESDEETNI